MVARVFYTRHVWCSLSVLAVVKAFATKDGATEKRHALILAGAVSPLADRVMNAPVNGSAHEAAKFSDIAFCAATIKQHLVGPNSVGVAWDYFMHSWNPGLKAALRENYDFTAAEFEENQPYETALQALHPESQWGALSHSLSIGKGIALMFAHEAAHPGVWYERAIVTRPDVLTFHDLELAKLARGGPAYCNSHGKGSGDFHWVFERWHLEALRDAVYGGAAPEQHLIGGHGKMRSFLAHAFNNTNRGQMLSDNQIFPGFDQDVYRKVRPRTHTLTTTQTRTLAQLLTLACAVRYAMTCSASSASAASPRPSKATSRAPMA
jgi:hypothetical protein